MGDPNQLNTPIECGKQLSLCEEGESVDPRIVAYLLSIAEVKTTIGIADFIYNLRCL